jgi:YidC/Oxa1 family membrane protein insertase
LAIGTAIITPLYYVTSAILMAWHWLFDLFLPTGAGITWVLSIVGLTVTIRALLIPLFVRQIKASRNMQLLQPRVKELQKKYGHDRERLGQETMKLYKDSGTNPFASCLPLLLQAPIFLSLFRLLDNAANGDPKGILDERDADSIAAATIFGARIADTFIMWWQGEAEANVGILTTVLVLAMVATTFVTQRQLMRKNMPESALTGQYAQQQKILLYVLPVVFAVGGIAFPVGVILYWTTSNLWTMGQQFYVIRNNPAPGTPAFEAKQERDRKHGKTVALDPTKDTDNSPPVIEKPRQQPKRQPRSRRRPGPSAPGSPASHAPGSSDSSGSGSSSSGSGSSTRRPVSGNGNEPDSPQTASGAKPPAPKKPPSRPNANKSRKKRRK